MPEVKITGASKGRNRTALDGSMAAGDGFDYDAEDVAEKAVAGDTLAALKALAQELIDESRAVAEAQRTLVSAQIRLADVQEHRLPDLMDAHDLPKFEFFDRTTGLTLIIKLEKDKWRVSLPPLKDDKGNTLVENIEARKLVYAWLRDIGQGGSIKKNMEVALGLVPDAEADGIVQQFKETHPSLDAVISEKIEPATLTALVTRLLKADKTVHEKIAIKPVREARVVKK